MNSWRRRAAALALVLGAIGLATAALAAQNREEQNPWLRPPSFDVSGGPGSVHITEATAGDPVAIGRWHVAENGGLAIAAADRVTIGPAGDVYITDLPAGVWLVATEGSVAWAVTVE